MTLFFTKNHSLPSISFEKKVVDHLCKRYHTEAETEPEQAAGVGQEGGEGDGLLAPDRLDVRIPNHQLDLGQVF